VVSLVPNFNRSICQSLAQALPGVPLVTILTDIADYPPHFWIERGGDQHFICGSAKAVEQARALGHPAEKVHRVSGMILNPRFYEIPPLAPGERARARAELGFDRCGERTAALVERASFFGHDQPQNAAMRRIGFFPDRAALFKRTHDAVHRLGRQHDKPREIGRGNRAIGADHGERRLLGIGHGLLRERAVERKPDRCIRLAQQVGEIAVRAALGFADGGKARQPFAGILDHVISALICYQGPYMSASWADSATGRAK